MISGDRRAPVSGRRHFEYRSLTSEQCYFGCIAARSDRLRRRWRRQRRQHFVRVAGAQQPQFDCVFGFYLNRNFAKIMFYFLFTAIGVVLVVVDFLLFHDDRTAERAVPRHARARRRHRAGRQRVEIVIVIVELLEDSRRGGEQVPR